MKGSRIKFICLFFLLMGSIVPLYGQVLVEKIISYDNYGNPIEVESSNGNTTKYYYGSNTQPYTQAGINGVSGYFLTGLQKQKGSSIDAISGGVRPPSGDDHYIEATYNSFGFVTAIMDENGEESGFYYDEFHRLSHTKNPLLAVNRSKYLFSNALTGNYSTSSPNSIVSYSGITGLESDFSSSSGFSSYGDRSFNHYFQGDITLRLGDNGGNWSSVYRSPSAEDIHANVDVFLSSTYSSGSKPYLLAFNDNNNRFAVRYSYSNDKLEILRRKNGGSYQTVHTFSMNASPDKWYTVELEKRGDILTAWVYERDGSRSTGNYYSESGFPINWNPQVRMWSDDDYLYFTNLEYTTYPRARTESFIDGLGRDLHSQSTSGDKMLISSAVLYNERGLPESQSRPIEKTGVYGYQDNIFGTSFSAGNPLTNSDLESYYSGLIPTGEEEYTYSYSTYEESPLSRSNATYLPGSSQVNSSFSYGLNTTETFTVNGKTWGVNTLSKTVSRDPDGKETITYTDGWRRTIASGVNMNPNSDDALDDSGDLITTFEYDLLGNLIRSIDPLGNATTYEYNTLGQLVSRTLPDQTGATDYKYDKSGNLRFTQNAAHKQSGGEITKVLTHGGSDFTYDIDPVKNGVLSFNVSIATQYDDFDVWVADDAHSDEKIVLETAPFEDGWETYASRSMLVRKGNYKVIGQAQDGWDGWETSSGTIEFKPFSYSYTKYDELNRPIEIGEYYGSTSFNSADADATSFPSSDNTKLVIYKYDQENAYSGARNLQGKIAQVWYYDPNDLSVPGKTYYSYNELGLIEWVKQKIPGLSEQTIRYTYDNLGRLERIHFDPSGSANDHYLWYDYDDFGRLHEISSYGKDDKDNAFVEAVYTYFADGQVDQLILGEGAQVVDYDYTVQGWVDRINNPASMGEDVFASDLTYSLAGNISHQKWEQAGLSSSTYDYYYSYDNANRITKACFGSASCTSMSAFDVSYGYNKNGGLEWIDRRADVTSGNAYIDHSYESGTNKLSYVEINADILEFSHDPMGNVYENQVQGIDNTSYDWRSLPNWLIANGTALTYNYDAEGKRVKKEVVDGPVIYYVRGADGQTIAAYDGSGNLIFFNILAGGQIIGQIEN